MSPGAAAAVGDETITNASTLEWVLFNVCAVVVMPGWIGAYSPEARKRRVARFHGKRARRVWTKRVKYDVRKNFAETRLRVKGRFVKKEEEDLLKDLVGVV